MNKFSITVVALVVFLGGMIYMVAQDSQSGVTSGTNSADILSIKNDDHVQGDPYADVVLIEYADFECPACGAYHPLVQELAAKYSDQIAIVSRHFPLPFHQNARPAAWSVEAAGLQGQYHEMADLVFTSQAAWSSKAANVGLFYEYAEQLGLDMDQFDADVLSEAVKERVERDAIEGSRLGVNSTPSFYLQGEKLANMRTVEDFSTLIDAELIKVQSVKGGEKVHKHSDIKMYINGSEYDLSADKYQSTHELELHSDVHLHDGNGEMVHLHWSGVTVGDFLGSLGIGLDSECLTLDTGEKYCTDDENTLSLYANGDLVDDLAGYLVEDLDQILISYGDQADAAEQNASINDQACIYSELCPERGEAPTESCVGGLGSSCDGA